MKSDIKLFGSARCHKTQFYINFFKEKDLDFVFLDVERDSLAAEELRALFTTGKLNFPTTLVKDKKL